jgi:hypothetical protein
MADWARAHPFNVDFVSRTLLVPRVAAVPRAHKMFFALAPFFRMDQVSGVVTRVLLPAMKRNSGLAPLIPFQSDHSAIDEVDLAIGTVGSGGESFASDLDLRDIPIDLNAWETFSSQLSTSTFIRHSHPSSSSAPTLERPHVDRQSWQ